MTLVDVFSRQAWAWCFMRKVHRSKHGASANQVRSPDAIARAVGNDIRTWGFNSNVVDLRWFKQTRAGAFTSKRELPSNNYGYHPLYAFMAMVWFCMVGTFGRKLCARLELANLEFWTSTVWRARLEWQDLERLRKYQVTHWLGKSSSNESNESNASSSPAMKRQGTVVDHRVPCAENGVTLLWYAMII